MKPTLGETYAALELEIKFMDQHVANETDAITKNELRSLRTTLGQCLIQTRIIIDRKLRLSQEKHRNEKT
jgi:hypothetical protein